MQKLELRSPSPGRTSTWHSSPQPKRCNWHFSPRTKNAIVAMGARHSCRFSVNHSLVSAGGQTFWTVKRAEPRLGNKRRAPVSRSHQFNCIVPAKERTYLACFRVFEHVCTHPARGVRLSSRSTRPNGSHKIISTKQVTGSSPVPATRDLGFFAEEFQGVNHRKKRRFPHPHARALLANRVFTIIAPGNMTGCCSVGYWRHVFVNKLIFDMQAS